jgi:branched-chain amino acid transport system ATP-binding protein
VSDDDAPQLPLAQHDIGSNVEDAQAERLLEITDLVAGYVPGVDILRGVSMHVNRGELIGIIGPNGAGKSTLIKAVFGLVTVRSGSMVLDGESIVGRPGHELVAHGVGYVPQVRNVFGTLTVEENLRMGIFLRPDRFAGRRDEVYELFPVLADKRAARADSLSGGQRQVLAMGRALMMEPDLMLLDEPSAGLSPSMQDEIFERIGDINRAGVSVLIVEQNAHKALRICHRGYVLDQGVDAHTGAGADLLKDPRIIELYLGSLVRDHTA